MKRFLLCLLFVGVATPSFAQPDFTVELKQLTAAIRGARDSAEQEAFVPRLVSLGERAFEADAFDIAATAFDYARRIDRANHPARAAEHKRNMDRARAAAKAYARLAAYRDRDDATARRKIAEFQAFVKGDWQTALPVLAEGDNLIAQAAQLDLQRLGVEEAEAAADAWVAAAKRSSTNTKSLYERAGYLYAAAAAVVPTPSLMKKMAVLGSRIGYNTSPPAGAIHVKGKYVYSTGTPCSPTETAKQAFDGRLDTFAHIYAGSGAWIAVDLRVPRAISRIVYAPHDSPPEWQQFDCERQVGAVVQVSNRPDFVDAITIYTVTEASAPRRLTVVTVAPSGVWRYVRYVAKPGDRLALGEFDVY